MTISSINANRTQVVGNGSWTDITINWPMFLNSDGTHAIRVIKTTIATSVTEDLTETTDFTVSLSGTSPSTGTITIVGGAPTSAYRFTVVADISKKQETDLQNAVQVDMPSIEAALDKLTLMVQQQDELLSRAVILNPDTTVTDINLPSFGLSDANKIVTINSTGDGMTTVDVDTLVSVSGFDIDSLEEAGAVDTAADWAVIHDESAGGMKKVQVEDLAPPLDINSETTIDVVDTASDELLIYDASSGTNKKVTPANLGLGSSSAHGDILQIQSVTKTDTSVISSNSTTTNIQGDVIPGLSVSFTPSKKDSKLIVGGFISIAAEQSSTLGIEILQGTSKTLELEEDGQYTDCVATTSAFFSGGYGSSFDCIPVYQVLDAKSTDPRDIKVNIKGHFSYDLYINRTRVDSDSTAYARGVSHLWVMEVSQESNASDIYSTLSSFNTKQVFTTPSTSFNSAEFSLLGGNGLSVIPSAASSYNLFLSRLSVGTQYGSFLDVYRDGSKVFTLDSPSSRTQTMVQSGYQGGLCQSTGFVESVTDAHEYKIFGKTSSGTSRAMFIGQQGTSETSRASETVFLSSLNMTALNFNTTVSGTPFKQVVTTNILDTSSGSCSQTTYFDPGLSVTLTPTNASSKLLFTFFVNASSGSSSNDHTRFKLLKDGSDILVGSDVSSREPITTGIYMGSTGYLSSKLISFVVDAGSTDSATYKLVIGSETSGATTTYLNRTSTDSDSAQYPRAASSASVIEILPN